jgi:uncharacterized protein YuzE
MKMKLDQESEVLYLRISEKPIEESEEVSKGLIVDYDSSGKVVGIELLNVKIRHEVRICK